MEEIGKLRYSMSEIIKEGRFGRMVRGQFKNSINVHITIVSKSDFSVELAVLDRTRNLQNVLHTYCYHEDNAFS